MNKPEHIDPQHKGAGQDGDRRSELTSFEPSGTPVLAVCGWKNSGKTTLIESLLPELIGHGLVVAVIKHDAHGIEVDRPGKDSDRFFRAGADVVLQGPGEEMIRRRVETTGAQNVGGESRRLKNALSRLANDADLVLVEGHKNTPLPKIWLHCPDRPDEPVPPGVDGVLASLGPDDDRIAVILDLLRRRLRENLLDRPLYACLLIGGGNRRLGYPKHLLRERRGDATSRTWLERNIAMLEEVACNVVIAGAGELPEAVASTTRFADVPGVLGPMAGIISALRWAPDAAWLVAACDMPWISPEALTWLLDQRAPGVRAILPRLVSGERDGQGVEPLLSWYAPHARVMLEELAFDADFSLQSLSGRRGVIHPKPPADLAAAWRGVNTEKDLERYYSVHKESDMNQKR